MAEADGIEDDNSDNVVENQPKSEDFISKEVGRPVSVMESEESDSDREDDCDYHYD